MKKMLKDEYVQIAIIMTSIFAVLMIPLIYIGFFAHPCADDYTYGYYTHAFWSTTHSFSETLKWAFYQVKATYDTWQGTFSSVFLMTLSPAVWGEGYYFVTPLIMFGMLIGSHFYLLYVLIIKLIKSSKSIWLITASVLVLLQIQTVYSPVNAFYWFNGSVHYNFMHACMIFLFATALQIGTNNKTYKEVLLCMVACILAILCGGANYSTALLGILGCSVLLIMKWFKKKKAVWYFVPIVIYAFAFYKNVTAYGNAVRQASFNKNTPINAIIQSFQSSNQYIGECISINLILFMVMMIPIFWKLTEQVKYKVWMPLLVTVISYCSIACMFTPSCYAMSFSGPERLLNIIKFWFILLLFINEALWIGFIAKFFREKEFKFKVDVRQYVFVVLILIVVFFVINVENRMYDYSSYAAYVSLKTGEAEQYHEEYLQRVEMLESEESFVVLQAFTQKPWLLYFDDITTDAYDWRNNAMKLWYGKEGVILEQ